MPMALSIQIVKLGVCQYQLRAVLPNLIHYLLHGNFVDNSHFRLTQHPLRTKTLTAMLCPNQICD